jgi:hypothetical protein
MKKSLFFLFSLLCTIATAQYTTNTAANTTVRDDAAFEEAVPIAVLGNSGNAMITYFNSNAGGTYDFSMQTLDLNGNYFIGSTGATISTYPQSTSVTIYDTKSDGEGNLVTAFMDYRSGSGDVVGYRMGPAGTFAWGPAGISLHDSLSAGGIAPNVGILPNGDAVISWTADGTPKDWVAIQRISPTGVIAYATPLRIIDSTNAATCTQSQVVPMHNGDFMIFYTKQTGFFPPICNMYMQRFNPAGQPVWAQPVHLSNKTISAFAVPSVIPDGNNGAYIGFSSSSPNLTIQNDVYVQHIDANGTLWSAMGTEACTGVNSQRLSPVVCFENGMPYPVVLIKETDLGQSSAGVTIQAFDTTTGKILWSPNGIAVTPITAAYDEPYDIRSICGALIILYAEGPFGNNIMYATKVDYNGAPLWTPSSVTVSGVASNKLRGQLTPAFSDGIGQPQVVAVWEDERNGRGIYAQNIACDGSTGPQFTSGMNSMTNGSSTWSVYPNPGNHQFLRHYADNTETVSVSLTDCTGRLIAQRNVVKMNSGSNILSMDELFGTAQPTKGVYVLQVKGAESSAAINVVIQ